MHQPTGTRFETQVCSPEFEIGATKAQALDYLNEYRSFLDSQLNAGVPPGSPQMQAESMAAVIARNQQAYRQKMKEVAENHPEFLEALIRYSEAQARYRNATGMAEVP